MEWLEEKCSWNSSEREKEVLNKEVIIWSKQGAKFTCGKYRWTLLSKVHDVEYLRKLVYECGIRGKARKTISNRLKKLEQIARKRKAYKLKQSLKQTQESLGIGNTPSPMRSGDKIGEMIKK